MIQSSFAEEPSWVAMTSPQPDLMPLGAYAALDGPAVYWERPLSNESVAGLGVAESREVSCTGQPFAILDEITHPGRMMWIGDSADQRPLGPWFGGFAFDQRWRASPLWEAFPAAKWTLPELLIWRRGASSFATAFCSASAGLRQAERAVRSRLKTFEEKQRVATRGEGGARASFVTRSDRRAWQLLVDRALAAIESSSLSKVVLARRISAQSARPFDCARVLARLRQSVPACTIFSLRAPGGATFLGATPETLCRVRGRLLETEAIAGSAPGPGKPPLVPSDKEAREHRAVVDGIEQALRPLCAELQIDASPGAIGLPHLRHLRTAVRGRLRGEVALSEIVSALHPTPAVGGVPRDRALQFLAEHEDLDRGWYAGPIGWVGDGAAELAVAIRSALFRGGQADLFVGAGVVAGSTAEGEWLETEAKSFTLLEAIGDRVGSG